MPLFNRLLVVIVSLLLAGAAIAALAAGMGVLPIERMPVGDWLRDGLGILSTPGRTGRVAGLLGAAGTLLFSILVLYLEIRSLAMAERRPIVVTDGPDGTVTVSRAGLEHLAQHVAMEVDGVLEASTRVTGVDELHVRCRARVARDVKAPDLSEELQRRLRTGLERHIGRSVARISVHTQLEPFMRRAAARRG